MGLITTPETRLIIGCAMRVHTQVGPGVFESVYEECLAYELNREGLSFKRQVVLPVTYGDVTLARAFQADFVVAGEVLLELKSVEKVLPVHCMQVMTYLRLSGLHKGLLINFNTDQLKKGLKSFVWQPGARDLVSPHTENPT